MDIAAKIAGIAMIAAVFCILLREHEKSLSVLASVLACMGILLLTLELLRPVWSVAEQLRRMSHLSDVMTAPLWKVVGIGLLTHMASGVCADAGESALAKIVEVSGSILAVYTSIPLLSAVLSLLETLLGGAA